MLAGLPPPPGHNMTAMWYKEVKNYDWENPGYSQATGHFSQVVWKATKMIGVGMAQYERDGTSCRDTSNGESLRFQTLGIFRPR